MADAAAGGKPLNVFERYQTLWVTLYMVAGVLLGRLIPGATVPTMIQVYFNSPLA